MQTAKLSRLLPWCRKRLAIQGLGLETRDDTISIWPSITRGKPNLGIQPLGSMPPCNRLMHRKICRNGGLKPKGDPFTRRGDLR